MTAKQFAALLGFLFVAIWIRFDFGDAVLCLAGAAAFWIAAQLILGELNLAILQTRFGETLHRPTTQSPPSTRVR